jgi:hypothetical protein
MLNIPAGSWEYKVALNGSWDEKYGSDGPNIPLTLADPTSVTFWYDHDTHFVTDDVNSVITTAPGSYQSEIGCAADWDPACMSSWLQDPDGDGIYIFHTRAIPAGTYEVRVAHGRSWTRTTAPEASATGPISRLRWRTGRPWSSVTR